ncbi:MAG: flavin reductase family protein, partial [Chloroflexota bacterium]
GSHTLVIGEVLETLVSEDCLTDGKPDARKIKAMIYCQSPEQYFAFGEYLGKPHGIGLELKGKA